MNLNRVKTWISKQGLPKMGSSWRAKESSPFNQSSFVIVVGIRSGWVKYRNMVHDYDEPTSMKAISFLRSFKEENFEG